MENCCELLISLRKAVFPKMLVIGSIPNAKDRCNFKCAGFKRLRRGGAA